MISRRNKFSDKNIERVVGFDLVAYNLVVNKSCNSKVPRGNCVRGAGKDLEIAESVLEFKVGCRGFAGWREML